MAEREAGKPAPKVWSGRLYEDFDVGDVFRSRLGRTITDADNVWFTCLTMNTNQIHFNVPYAARTRFGRPLVNSALTLALVTGLTVPDTSEHATANLAWGTSGSRSRSSSATRCGRRARSWPGASRARTRTSGS